VTDLAGPSLRRRYNEIYRYLRRRTKDTDHAEELTQDVFAAAAEALAGLESSPYPLDALLYTIARRRFADYAREGPRRAAIRPLDGSEQAVAPRYQGEVVAAIQAGVMRLEPDQRQVVVWKLLEGRSFAEISRKAGATEAACKMRFSRALHALRGELEKEGFSP
jgi:RNA polymerase sigma factor (sigma-70 family)